MTESTARVRLAVSTNRAYSPSDINEGVTLGVLLDALRDAVEEHGEDARVVLDNGERYGAPFGFIDAWDDLFTPVEADDEEAAL